MLKILLLVTTFLLLNACQSTKENKNEINIIQQSDNDQVLELIYDEREQKFVLQKAKSLDQENIINISKNGFSSTNEANYYTKQKLNKELVIEDIVGIQQLKEDTVTEDIIAIQQPQEYEEERETVIEDVIAIQQPQEEVAEDIIDLQQYQNEPVSEEVITIQKPKEVYIDVENQTTQQVFNLENPEILGTGMDIVFGKRSNEFKGQSIKQKKYLGSGSDVVFYKSALDTTALSERTELPIDFHNIDSRKQQIIETQLKEQYQKEQALQRIASQNISKNAFEKFSREINEDISNLENIKKSYQNIEENTEYFKNNDNSDMSLALLQQTYRSNKKPTITNISLESIKKTVSKVAKNKSIPTNKFMRELLQLQSSKPQPLKKNTKKYDDLFILKLSSIKTKIKQKFDALEKNTKMWQSIDLQSNKLVKNKIMQNNVLKIQLAKLKKRLNNQKASNISEDELYNIIKQLNQLNRQLNNSNKIQVKKTNPEDINELLKELKRAKN